MRLTHIRLNERPIALQLVILGTLIVFSTLLFSIIAQMLSTVMYPDGVDHTLQGLREGNIQAIGYFKMMQLVTSIALFVIPPLLFAWFYNGNISNFFGLRNSLNINLFLAIIVLMPVAIPLINATQILNQAIHFPSFMSDLEKSIRAQDEEYTVFQDAFLSDKTIGGLSLNLFMMAVIPAIGEEMLFRGLLQKLLSKYIKNFHIPILITSFVFSAIHFQFFSFIPRFLLGMAFGYIFYWSGNLIYPMIAHFVNNAMAVVVVFLVNTKQIADDPTITANSPVNWIQALGSALLIGLLLMIFQKNFEKTKAMQCR